MSINVVCIKNIEPRISAITSVVVESMVSMTPLFGLIFFFNILATIFIEIYCNTLYTMISIHNFKGILFFCFDSGQMFITPNFCLAFIYNRLFDC